MQKFAPISPEHTPPTDHDSKSAGTDSGELEKHFLKEASDRVAAKLRPAALSTRVDSPPRGIDTV